jgi:hypothetical protein
MAGTWFGVLAFSLFGLAFGIAGLVRLVGLSWLRSNGISAAGRVVRLEEKRLPPEGDYVYTPVAEFEANGRRYEAGGASTFPPLYGVGDSVQVCYPPDRPDRGQIVTGRERAVAWLFLALGIVFGVVAFAIARLGGTI